MSDEDRAHPGRARGFVDELIPYEVEAEMNARRAARRRLERSSTAVRSSSGCPRSTCRRSSAARASRRSSRSWFRAARPGHERPRAGSCTRRPRGLPERGDSEHQMETWIQPTIRGETHECYAITEEGAGSDVDAIAGHRAPRRRRLRAERREVARDVASTTPSYVLLPGQARRGAARGRARDVLRRRRHARRARSCATPAYSHTYADHHPLVRVRGRAGAGRQPGRRRGRRHGVHLRVVPLRAADDRARAAAAPPSA